MKDLKDLLKQAGYPEFKFDESGLPQPGQVVKCFRERMVYQVDGQNKHWTQEDLGQRLGVKDWQVRMMETKGKGLDSIERRRALVDLLKIPPALLGLGSVESLIELLEKKSSVSSIVNSSVGKEQLDLYNTALDIYEEKYMQGSLNNSIQDIEKWISRIVKEVKLANNNDLLNTLYKFYILAAKVYGYGLFSWENANRYIDNSLEIAELLKALDLNATSLYISGDFKLSQHRPLLAIRNFENSVSLNVKSQQTGAAYSALAMAKAMAKPEESLVIQRTLDKAEAYASLDHVFSIQYDTCKYLIDRSDTLIMLGRYKTALECLDDVEELYTLEPKRQEYINILRAESYIKKKKPEYEQAILLMQEVLENNKRAEHAYHIQYVDRLYKSLQKSSCANAPDVADIGLMLKDFKNGNKI